MQEELHTVPSETSQYIGMDKNRLWALAGTASPGKNVMARGRMRRKA